MVFDIVACSLMCEVTDKLLAAIARKIQNIAADTETVYVHTALVRKDAKMVQEALQYSMTVPPHRLT